MICQHRVGPQGKRQDRYIYQFVEGSASNRSMSWPSAAWNSRILVSILSSRTAASSFTAIDSISAIKEHQRISAYFCGKIRLVVSSFDY